MRSTGMALRLSLVLTVFCMVPLLGAQSSSKSVEGWLNVVWDLQTSRDNPEGIEVFLVTVSGERRRLHGTPAQLRDAALLDRRFVRTVVADLVNPPAVPEKTAQIVSVTPAPLPDGPALSTQVSAKNFITILCRYADDPSTPITVAENNTVTGTTYPGVAHYYGELSQDPSVMAGNRAVGWYDMPRPRSAYIRGDTIDVGALANDCTAAADADVDFPSWYGINLQINGELGNRTVPPYDPLSLGGSWFLNRDGVSRVYGMTWFGGSFKKNYVVYDHEMGHALGWPHSSGRYGQEYDSRWDVMSVGYLNFTQQYGWLSIHTIASHKDRVGWIPSSRKWIPQPATSEARVIARSALPPANGDMLMAEIRISDRSVYTVEARRVAGYDTPLPGEAILIHRVDDGRAYVVDPDENGNPNDAGAMWVPGETFIDAPNAISVSVESATATGFSVRITRGGSAFTIVGSAERPTALINAAYADTIAAQGALGPPSWNVSAGSLPPGLLLSSPSGIISGVPTTAGRYSFTLTATAGSASAARDFVTEVAAPISFAVGAARRDGSVGSPYADTVRATGGSGSYQWSVSAGLTPTGISIDSQTGVLSGTPSVAGSFDFSVTAQSTVGTRSLTATMPMTAIIHSALLIVSDSVRPAALMGAPYTDTLKSSGSVGSASWRVTEGDLPKGLSLSAGGIISGVPTEAVQSRFVVSANTDISSTTRIMKVLVTKPVIAQEKVIEQLLGAGTLNSAELKFLDLLGNRNDRFDLGDVRAWLIDTGRMKAAVRAEKVRRDAIDSTAAKSNREKR